MSNWRALTPNSSLEQEILSHLHNLGPTQQQVLTFVRTLAKPPSGLPGRELLRFAGTIELDDLQTMTQAIEEGYEKVNDAAVKLSITIRN